MDCCYNEKPTGSQFIVYIAKLIYIYIYIYKQILIFKKAKYLFITISILHKLVLFKNDINLETIFLLMIIGMASNKKELSSHQQSSLIKFLINEKFKPCNIYSFIEYLRLYNYNTSKRSIEYFD